MPALRGGLQFNEIESSTPAGPGALTQTYGVLQYQQGIRFNAVRQGGVYFILDDLGLGGKDFVRQISKRTGYRIIDLKERAYLSSSAQLDTSGDAFLQGEEAQQAQFLAELARVDKGPPNGFWDKAKAINETTKSIAYLGAPLDILVNFKEFFDRPTIGNFGELLAALSIGANPIRGAIEGTRNLIRKTGLRI